MFSSNNNNNNSYPLFYNQSPSFFTNRAIPESNNNIFFQHYYGKFLPPTSYPPISDNSIVNLSSEPSINQQNGLLCPSNVRVSSSRRAAGKKDRHTKITTAQGVRDRRVRLSMSIAREFFNLQDMLGFDKASKTLGWLLTNSKAAIDELASTSNFKPPVTPDENEVVVINEEDQHQEYCTSNNNDDEKSSSKKRKRRENSHLNNTRNVVNELRRREEARERARERTRKKKIVDDHHLESSSSLMICHQSNPAIMSNNNNNNSNNNNTLSSNGLISKEGSSPVRESVVIKGNYNNKSKGSSYNNYNYEMISSKDEQHNCNYYNDYFNKSASESCNYYSGILQPTGFPALNIINLSTEIHINARPWDTYSNHILH